MKTADQTTIAESLESIDAAVRVLQRCGEALSAMKQKALSPTALRHACESARHVAEMAASICGEPGDDRPRKQPSRARYLTVPEVAQLMRVSPTKVRGWIERGELKAINLGHGRVKPRYHVTHDAVEAFELLRQVLPPAPRPKRRRRDPRVIEFYK